MKILIIPAIMLFSAGVGLLKIYQQVSQFGTPADKGFFQLACGLEGIFFLLFLFACYLLTRDPLGHIEE